MAEASSRRSLFRLFRSQWTNYLVCRLYSERSCYKHGCSTQFGLNSTLASYFWHLKQRAYGAEECGSGNGFGLLFWIRGSDSGKSRYLVDEMCLIMAKGGYAGFGPYTLSGLSGLAFPLKLLELLVDKIVVC